MRFDRVIAVRNNKTVYRDGDTCIKVFRCGYASSDVLREAFHHAYVRELGVDVPTLFRVTQYKDEWAIEMQHIRGKTLQQMLAEADADRDDCIRQLAAVHAALHRHAAPMLPYQRDAVLRRIRALDADGVDTERLCTQAEALAGQGCLCHGDFQPSNILIGLDGIRYVLDWPHAVQGDPRFDAAVTCLRLLTEYGAAASEIYLAAYTRASDRADAEIRAFFALAAASLWTVVGAGERAALKEFLQADT